jgi:hypothetical protein
MALLLLRLAPADGADPATVASAYEAARGLGDTDALLGLFAADAVITDPLGHSHTGHDEIRRLLQIASSRGRALPIAERLVRGNHVSWVEPTATPNLNFALHVEAVVQGGRITSLAYRGGDLSQAEPPAVAGSLLPAPLGLAAALMAMTVGMMLLGLVRPRAATDRRSRQALLGALRRWSEARRPYLPERSV